MIHYAPYLEALEQVPSPPLARAAIGSWRPLPGHQREHRETEGTEEQDRGSEPEAHSSAGAPHLPPMDIASRALVCAPGQSWPP